jgi:hypothetical protein
MKLRTLLTLGAVMLFATGAQAQFGIKIGGKKKLSVGMGDLDPSKPSKDQRKALSTVNSMSQKGAGKVPGNWSSGYEKKSARFAEAVKIHDDLTALIKKKKLKKLKPWSNVERYWNTFDAKVTQGKLQLPVLKAYEPVKSAFSSKKLVDAKLITELQAATKAYSAGASDGNKKNAEWFAKFAAEAPETNKKLEAAGASEVHEVESAAGRAKFLVMQKRWRGLERRLPYPIKGCSDTVKWVCAADKFVTEINGSPNIEDCNRRLTSYWKRTSNWRPSECRDMMAALIALIRETRGEKLTRRAALRTVIAPPLLSHATKHIRHALIGPVEASIESCLEKARSMTSNNRTELSREMADRIRRALRPLLEQLAVMYQRSGDLPAAIVDANWARTTSQLCETAVVSCSFNTQCGQIP